MNYLLGRLIIAKYIIFNRGIRLSFETYRQHFYSFANLAFDCIMVILRKYNSLLSCFCKIEIRIKLAINGIYFTYVTIIER